METIKTVSTKQLSILRLLGVDTTITDPSGEADGTVMEKGGVPTPSTSSHGLLIGRWFKGGLDVASLVPTSDDLTIGVYLHVLFCVTGNRLTRSLRLSFWLERYRVRCPEDVVPTSHPDPPVLFGKSPGNPNSLGRGLSDVPDTFGKESIPITSALRSRDFSDRERTRDGGTRFSRFTGAQFDTQWIVWI